MSKQTIVLLTALVAITIALVYIAVSPASKNKTGQVPTTVSTKPTEIPVNAKSVLSFSPNPLTLSSPSGTLDVNIDSGGNKVTGVQLELEFNPKVLSNIEIKPATFFAQSTILLNNIDYKNGRISYAIVIPPTGNPKTGIGTVATISLNALKGITNQTVIKFSPKSLVTAEGEVKSVLKSATDATIVFSQ